MHRTIAIILAVTILFGGCSFSMHTPFDYNSKIHVISREDGSGTRNAFTELTGVSQKENDQVIDKTTLDAAITNSTSVVMASVEDDVHAIGYLSLGSLNDTVKALIINDIKPEKETIKNGDYPIARPFLLAVKEGSHSEAADDFISFILSADGQKVIEDSGYVGIEEGKPYTVNSMSGKVVVGGSSSVTPAMEKLKEAYIKLQPGVAVEIQQSDSTTGITSAIAGVYDIGMSSRWIKDSELEQGIVPITIAMDGIVLIVNNSSPIDRLTMEQVKSIFAGNVEYWTEIEGAGNP